MGSDHSASEPVALGDLVRSPAADAIFSERSTLARFLEVEVALASTQAKLGLIPTEAASAIAAYATVDRVDLVAYRESFKNVGFPIVGLVRQLAQDVPDGHGQYAHWGATTQDIMDTALVLQLREALVIMERDLGAIAASLAIHAETHRDTLMAGRSQLQHAVPMTFGFKVAGWLSAIQRHQERLTQLKPRVLCVQFGGAIGTLASLDKAGLDVQEALAAKLGLGVPVISWHSHRDSLAETISFCGVLTATLAKIATDVLLMTQTEVDELREPSLPGRGVSSTMPQKHNPILSQQILAASRLIRPQVAAALSAMVQDHERGSGRWQMEWNVVPETMSFMLAALERTQELVEGLEVRAPQMQANLDRTRGLISAEAVMMALAPKLGRQRAHDVVAEAATLAQTQERDLAEVLCEHGDVRAVLSEDEVARVLDPRAHLSSSHAMIDRVLAGMAVDD
jgi:3-carboxy-cis,cis-muconate cycloisomerase